MLLNSQIQGFIHLERPSYSPGEQVNGTVSLEVNTPIQATDLELKFLGGEFVHFVQLEKEHIEEIDEDGNKVSKQQDRYGNYSQNRVFYNFKNSIYEFQRSGTEVGIIEPGQYQFPFSFVLGAETPSTFSYSWKNHGHRCNATIQYIITANILDKNRGLRQGGGIAGNLAHKELIVVPRDDGLGRNRRMEVTETISQCCQSHGESKLVAYFEKDRYSIGSTAFIVLEIDNRFCNAAIKDVDVKFTQKLSFKAQGQEQRKISTFKEIKGEGCEANSSRKGGEARRFEIVISGSKPDETDIFGSCHGELVECRHKISITANMDITCYCGRRPQIQFDIPVYKEYGNIVDLYPSFMATNWNPQINSTFMFNPLTRPSNKLDISINPFNTGQDTDLSYINDEFQMRRRDELDRLSERGILHKLDPRESQRPSYYSSSVQNPILSQRPSIMRQPMNMSFREPQTTLPPYQGQQSIAEFPQLLILRIPQ